MIFFEKERSKVRTLRVSFQGIARFFAPLGGFDLGWYWLSTKEERSSFFPIPHNTPFGTFGLRTYTLVSRPSFQITAPHFHPKFSLLQL